MHCDSFLIKESPCRHFRNYRKEENKTHLHYHHPEVLISYISYQHW
jgi:hypothetical protein